MKASSSAIRRRIVKVAGDLAREHRDHLKRLKSKHVELEQPDFLWHRLLRSFATMGRASGVLGLTEPRNYDRLLYHALESLPPKRRLAQAEAAFRSAKVRMPARKARFLCGCLTAVEALGGPEEATRRLLSQQGREAKIKFLKAFPGIGDKYARNIMMDVYHEDFRDSIAIDARIKNLSIRWGFRFSAYDEHEAFYLGIAADAGLNGWELDRLMFNYQDEFIARTKV